MICLNLRINTVSSEKEVVRLKKSLVSVVTVMAMICAFFAAMPAGAAEKGTVSVTADKEFVQKGGQVTYTVEFDGISDVRGIQLGLTYDAGQASYVDGSMKLESQDFADYSDFVGEDGSLGMVFAMKEGTDVSGAAASFVLAAGEDSSAGAMGLKVSSAEAVGAGGEPIELDVVVSDAEIISGFNAEFSAVPDKDSIGIGEETVYTVSMSELTVRGMQFSVEYDDAHFELAGVSAADGYETAVETKDDGSIAFVLYSEENITVSGELMHIRLRAKDTESSVYGLTPITVGGFKASDGSGELDVTYTSVCGEISVQKAAGVEISFNADKTEAGAGEIVSYTVVLNSISGYRGLQTALKYDLSKLEFVNVEPLSIMELADASFNTAVDGTVRIACVFTEESSTTGGELAKINFRVKDGASGIADMSVTGTKVSSDGTGYIDADYFTSVDEVFTYSGRKVVVTGVPSVESAYAGREVVYTFELSEVSGFGGMQFKLNYDSSVLNCTGIAKGSVLDSAVVKTITETSDGVIQGMINYSGGYTGGGVLFTASFEVSDVEAAIQPELAFTSFTSDDYITYSITPVNVYPLESVPEYSVAVDDTQVSVTQNRPGAGSVTLYIAQYGSDGTLKDVDIHDVAGSEVFDFVRDTETETVRCYIWDSQMIPHAES